MTDDPALLHLSALLDRHGDALLALAAAGIRYPLSGRKLSVRLADVPPELAQPGAAFVTLRRQEELRGCVGSHHAWRPLVTDVIENAAAAAFAEPRFARLVASELDGLSLSLSLLTRPTLVPAASEAELLTKLRPGRDGVTLTDAGRRGLFLPEMWHELPAPAEFMAWLKRKAGFPETHWSPSLQVWRFETLSIKAADIGRLPDPAPHLLAASRT